MDRGRLPESPQYGRLIEHHNRHDNRPEHGDPSLDDMDYILLDPRFCAQSHLTSAPTFQYVVAPPARRHVGEWIPTISSTVGGQDDRFTRKQAFPAQVYSVFRISPHPAIQTRPSQASSLPPHRTGMTSAEQVTNATVHLEDVSMCRSPTTEETTTT